MVKKENIGIRKVNAYIASRNKKVLKYSKKIRKHYFYCSTNIYAKKSENIIDIISLHKYYISNSKVIPALIDINLSIKSGDFTFIKGPSGSGKTTLMNTLCGMVKPTYGDILIDNYNIAFASDDLASVLRSIFFGFVFQTPNLIHLLTLRENINLAADLINKKRKKITNRIPFKLEDLCDSIGLDKTILDKYPYEVSGGQQQRANLVRALINNPEILLCDEPTSFLDKELTLSLLSLLKKINTRFQTTIIFITHDETICRVGNQVVHIEDGRINNINYNNTPKLPSLEDW